ncbi:ABC transporter ATP-binding protein [Mesorhizobium sp.]|uniref:ABC transporter ATP-binding protein n=1 Tax=Mesorhizobium sp. TaxID=1871066 RepID=UPI000FE54E42|nr:ABC transporter ATP-binding protein [Mesorhizobium sp.]RWA97839.1 MAG: ABC transporter ATP-binding protein [Mesorhizobium sp.]
MSHLIVENVSKSFGPFKALENVNLTVGRSEIRAVLGENGAGKTSLMNVLYGLYRPDNGRVLIDGAPIVLNSPRDAIGHRIGMIHQHFQLASALTVTENILLGTGGVSLNLKQQAARICEISEQYGFDVDPDAPVWKLPIGMRQRVEILKVLYRNAEILVLDEPTSVLAPDEIGSFLDGLKKIRAAGHTILFVTHKLDEVMEVADNVTIMRQGRVIAEVGAAETTPKELSRLMVGRESDIRIGNRVGEPGRAVLEVVDVCAQSDRGASALKSLSFSLREGEVFGLTGVDGNGQRELAEVIVGMRPLTSGDILVEGESISHLDVRERVVNTKIGFVPEDRHATGLVLDYSVSKNLVLRSFDREPVSRNGIIDYRHIAERAVDLIARYDIRLRSAEQQARFLSGGNQQKIILAREIESRPRILLVMQATKGLDVGAIEFVQNKILEERARGVAVLYISTELEHLLEVADRVGVICAGRLTGILAPEHVTAQKIGMMMAGVTMEAA